MDRFINSTCLHRSGNNSALIVYLYMKNMLKLESLKEDPLIMVMDLFMDGSLKKVSKNIGNHRNNNYFTIPVDSRWLNADNSGIQIYLRGEKMEEFLKYRKEIRSCTRNPDDIPSHSNSPNSFTKIITTGSAIFEKISSPSYETTIQEANVSYYLLPVLTVVLISLMLISLILIVIFVIRRKCPQYSSSATTLESFTSRSNQCFDEAREPFTAKNVEATLDKMRTCFERQVYLKTEGNRKLFKYYNRYGMSSVEYTVKQQDKQLLDYFV